MGYRHAFKRFHGRGAGGRKAPLRDVIPDSDIASIPANFRNFFRFIVGGDLAPIDFSSAKDSQYKTQLISIFQRKGMQYLSEGKVGLGMRCFSFCAETLGPDVLTKVGDRILTEHPHDALSAYKLARNRDRMEQAGDHYFANGIFDVAINAYKLAYCRDKLRKVAEQLLRVGSVAKAKSVFYWLGEQPDDICSIASELIKRMDGESAFEIVWLFGTKEDMISIGRKALKAGLPDLSMRCFEHAGEDDGVADAAKVILRSEGYKKVLGLIESGRLSVSDIGVDELSRLGRRLLDKGDFEAAERVCRLAGDSEGLAKLARALAGTKLEKGYTLLEEADGRKEDFIFFGDAFLSARRHAEAIDAYSKAGLGPLDKKMHDAINNRFAQLAGAFRHTRASEWLDHLDKLIELSMVWDAPLREFSGEVVDRLDKVWIKGRYRLATDIAFVLGDRERLKIIRARIETSQTYAEKKQFYRDYVDAALSKDVAEMAYLNACMGYNHCALSLFRRLDERQKKKYGLRIAEVLQDYKPEDAFIIYHALGATPKMVSLVRSSLKEKPDEALSMAKKCRSPDAFNAVAEFFFEKKEFDRALQLFVAAGNSDAIRRMGMIYLAAGETEKAVSILKRVFDSLSSKDLAAIGKAFFSMDELQRARAYFRKAGMDIPKDLLHGAVDRLLATGDSDDLFKAKKYCMLAGEKSKLVIIGDAFAAKSMVGSAIRCYEGAGVPERKLDPELYANRNNLALGLEIFKRENAPKDKILALAKIAMEKGEIGIVAGAYKLAGEPMPVEMLEQGAKIFMEKNWSVRAMVALVMAGNTEKIELLLRSQTTPPIGA